MNLKIRFSSQLIYETNKDERERKMHEMQQRNFHLLCVALISFRIYQNSPYVWETQ